MTKKFTPRSPEEVARLKKEMGGTYTRETVPPHIWNSSEGVRRIFSAHNVVSEIFKKYKSEANRTLADKPVKPVYRTHMSGSHIQTARQNMPIADKGSK